MPAARGRPAVSLSLDINLHHPSSPVPNQSVQLLVRTRGSAVHIVLGGGLSGLGWEDECEEDRADLEDREDGREEDDLIDLGGEDEDLIDLTSDEEDLIDLSVQEAADATTASSSGSAFVDLADFPFIVVEDKPDLMDGRTLRPLVMVEDESDLVDLGPLHTILEDNGETSASTGDLISLAKLKPTFLEDNGETSASVGDLISLAKLEHTSAQHGAGGGGSRYVSTNSIPISILTAGVSPKAHRVLGLESPPLVTTTPRSGRRALFGPGHSIAEWSRRRGCGGKTGARSPPPQHTPFWHSLRKGPAVSRKSAGACQAEVGAEAEGRGFDGKQNLESPRWDSLRMNPSASPLGAPPVGVPDIEGLPFL